MKLNVVLKEDGAVRTFRDLEPFQVAMIKKLAKGNVDFENLSPNNWATVYQLQDLGLVDQNFDLTDKGARANEIANRIGGTDLRRARTRDRLLGRTGGPAQRYTDVDDDEDDTNTDEPDGFQDQWGSVRERDD